MYTFSWVWWGGGSEKVCRMYTFSWVRWGEGGQKRSVGCTLLVVVVNNYYMNMDVS